MSGHDDLQKGIFDALLLRDSLQRLSEMGIIATPEVVNETAQQSIDIRDFSPLIRHRATRMQQAYSAFFWLENAARDLISQRLAERYGASWWDLRVPQKIKQNVDQLKKKRIEIVIYQVVATKISDKQYLVI